MGSMSDDLIVCPLCVQWRCERCKSHDWPDCCDWQTEAEPYWPDGSVATLTQNDYCEPCATALAQYEQDVSRGV
jgi:hypothetical protein